MRAFTFWQFTKNFAAKLKLEKVPSSIDDLEIFAISLWNPISNYSHTHISLAFNSLSASNSFMLSIWLRNHVFILQFFFVCPPHVGKQLKNCFYFSAFMFSSLLFRYYVNKAWKEENVCWTVCTWRKFNMIWGRKLKKKIVLCARRLLIVLGKLRISRFFC